MGLANMGDYGLSPMPKTNDSVGGAPDWWRENMPQVPLAESTGSGTVPPGEGRAYPQVIVNGPNGWWKSSPDPNAPWRGPNGETLPPGQNPPGYQDPKSGWPTVASPSAPAPTGGAPNGDVHAFIAQWQQTHAPSEGIAGLTAALKAAGYPVEPYMYGSTASNNEILLNGQKEKVLGGEGTPAAYWYKPGTNDSPGGGSGGGGAPGMLDPWTQDFHERNPQEIANDPYYQFQMQQGLQGVQRSAAAKGTLLTGGTLKDLAGYSQGLASSFGDKAFARDQWKYLTSRDNFYGNQDRPFDKYYRLGQLGKPTGTGG